MGRRKGSDKTVLMDEKTRYGKIVRCLNWVELARDFGNTQKLLIPKELQLGLAIKQLSNELSSGVGLDRKFFIATCDS